MFDFTVSLKYNREMRKAPLRICASHVFTLSLEVGEKEETLNRRKKKKKSCLAKHLSRQKMQIQDLSSAVERRSLCSGSSIVCTGYVRFCTFLTQHLRGVISFMFLSSLFYSLLHPEEGEDLCQENHLVDT